MLTITYPQLRWEIRLARLLAKIRASLEEAKSGATTSLVEPYGGKLRKD